MRVEFKLDERIFTVFAALNICGYDDENREEGMHPVRLSVREELKKKRLTNAGRLKEHFSKCHEYHFVVWATWSSEPPDFLPLPDESEDEGWSWSEWISVVGEFNVNIRQFWQEADIHDLWTQYLPEYQKEIQIYKPLTEAQIARMLEYIRMDEMPEGRKVVHVPNLLDAYWRGYGSTVRDMTYLVIGPSHEPNIGIISHEAMHSISNPLVEKHAELLAETKHLYALVEEKMSRGYGTWVGTVQENVVRAIDIRLEAANQAKEIANEERRGFIFVRDFCRELENYERSNESFESFMPRLLSSLKSFSPKEREQ